GQCAAGHLHRLILSRLSWLFPCKGYEALCACFLRLTPQRGGNINRIVIEFDKLAAPILLLACQEIEIAVKREGGAIGAVHGKTGVAKRLTVAGVLWI